MAERFEIAIIGSGPAGLSAGSRAAARGLSHIVLERERRCAETIQKYQRGKLVMAAPEILPLRSGMSFAEGSREAVLGTWEREIAEQRINIRHSAEVTKVSGRKGAFSIALRDGAMVEAANIVLAIGMQGDLRKLGVPGDAPPFVQYQLDDPEMYVDETIVVVGASDSAIENAVALASRNQVVLVNRGKGFPKAKARNAALITKAVESGKIECLYDTTPQRVEPGAIYLNTPEGTRVCSCTRVIARLGGNPPRKFLEDCGVVVPKGEGPAYPEVSDTYETNVPGLYAIGAIVGYPLIKQCMNQGYEVVEAIAGTPVPPADEPLLEERLLGLPGRPSVGVALAMIRAHVRLLQGLKTLQLRDLLLDSETRVVLAGETIYRHKEFGDSLFLIATGTVEIECPPDERDPTAAPRLADHGEGEFFGEAGLVAGRSWFGTARAKTDCVLIQLARRAALKLLASDPAAKKEFDRITVMRQLREDLLPDLSEADLAGVLVKIDVKRFKPDDVLIKENARDDPCAYLIRSGSVTISRQGKVIAHEPAGRLVGEMALLRPDAVRSATVTAAILTEAIRIDGTAFRGLLEARPDLRARVYQIVRERLEGRFAERDADLTGMAGFFAQKGVTEATDVLLIDEALCIRCDNCEKACAESHDGISRLDREAGPTFATLHVPTACRHCELPHCMKDCPPNSIHRGPDGEVWIDEETCIGCENCKDNCPYGVIRMAAKPPEKPGLLAWLLLGFGSGPGEDKAGKAAAAVPKGDTGLAAKKKAVKCDSCKDIEGGPACVRACPTGAAFRVNPAEYLNATTVDWR